MSTAPGDEFQDDVVGTESGTGADTTQDDYASRTGQSHIPVQKDGAAIEAGGYEDRKVADSDEQLSTCFIVLWKVSANMIKLATMQMLSMNQT